MLPFMGTNALQVLYSMVDMIIAGRFVNQVGVIAIIFAIVFVILMTCGVQLFALFTDDAEILELAPVGKYTKIRTTSIEKLNSSQSQSRVEVTSAKIRVVLTFAKAF